MTCKITIFNMKGGVGKSTTAYNLAVGLVKFHGKKVLLVDIDAQGNSSIALGIKVHELEKQLKDVLERKMKMRDVIIKTDSGVDVAPSNILLAQNEIGISGLNGRELLLRKAIASISYEYDFIVIDCPPNMGIFSINGLVAGNSLIIPVDMSFLGLVGLTGIEAGLNSINESLDHSFENFGVLATRFDSRNNLSKEVFETLKTQFPDQMFSSVIPESVKLREAPSSKLSIFDYDPKGLGAKAYANLVNEVLKWERN